MKKIKIYLKTALFAPDPSEEIPPGSLIVEGEVVEQISNGLIITISHYYDFRHKKLKGDPITIFIPMGKIDHIRLQD